MYLSATTGRVKLNGAHHKKDVGMTLPSYWRWRLLTVAFKTFMCDFTVGL